MKSSPLACELLKSSSESILGEAVVVTGVAGRSTWASGVGFLVGGAVEGARWSAMSSAFRLREAVEGGVVMFWESRSRRDDETSSCNHGGGKRCKGAGVWLGGGKQ